MTAKEDHYRYAGVGTCHAFCIANPGIPIWAGGARGYFYGPLHEAPPKAAPARATAPALGKPGSAPVDPWVATSLRLHDIEAGRLLFEMDLAGINLLGLVPGSNTCVCEAADGTISFRELKTGQELRRVTLRPNPPPRKLSPLETSPAAPPEKSRLTTDGKRLVKPIWQSGFGLFDLDSGAEVARFKTSETSGSWQLETLVLAPSGLTAVVYLQRNVHLWTFPSPAASKALAENPSRRVRALPGTARHRRRRWGWPLPALTLGERPARRLRHERSRHRQDHPPGFRPGTRRRRGQQVRDRLSGNQTHRALGPRHLDPRRRFPTLAVRRHARGDRPRRRFRGTAARHLVVPGCKSRTQGPETQPAQFRQPREFQGACGRRDRTPREHERDAARIIGGDFEFSHGGWTGKTRIRASYDGSLFGICRADNLRVAAELALKVDAARFR